LPAPPTVLRMPRWAGSNRLVEQLGPERAHRLDELLLARAEAAVSAAGAVLVAGVAGDALVHPAAPATETGEPESLGALVSRVWTGDRAAGPLLVVWPDLPRWRPAHLDAALSDLADGCDLSLGPVFDGGFYLLALAHPLPGLLELPAEAWRRPDAMTMTLAVAAKGDIAAGLLRAERALRTPADVAAALADPLLDRELRQVLG
jgi:Uncharacterized protein conserved in bacteria (DUF2064)